MNFTSTTVIAPYESALPSSYPITLATFDKYVNSAKEYYKYFSNEVLEQVLAQYKESDIIGLHSVPERYHHPGNYYAKNFELYDTQRRYHFEEHMGEWKRDIYETAYRYKVPYTYQSVALNRAIREMVPLQWPYMKNYVFEAYDLQYGSKLAELYVHIEGKSLYVPYEALSTKDPTLIVKRQTTYWSDYYSRPENKENLDKMLQVLNSPAAKQLFKEIEGKED